MHSPLCGIHPPTFTSYETIAATTPADAHRATPWGLGTEPLELLGGLPRRLCPRGAQWGTAEIVLSADKYLRQPHGIGVDVDGKVWVVTFNTGATFVYADTVLNGDSATRPKIKQHTVGLIRIYNANGTENAMSPLVYGVRNGVRTDTLGVFCGNKDAVSGRRICESRTGRGLRMAPDGLSVYVSLFDTIFRFDTKTGALLGKVAPYAGTAAARNSLITPG